MWQLLCMDLFMSPLCFVLTDESKWDDLLEKDSSDVKPPTCDEPFCCCSCSMNPSGLTHLTLQRHSEAGYLRKQTLMASNYKQVHGAFKGLKFNLEPGEEDFKISPETNRRSVWGWALAVSSVTLYMWADFPNYSFTRTRWFNPPHPPLCLSTGVVTGNWASRVPCHTPDESCHADLH